MSDADDVSDGESLVIAPGTRVGPFKIVRLLGRGGMATVYEAFEEQLQRAVALKVLPPEFLHDRTFARRFEQEARVVAKLEHPHIVPIFATGIDDGIPWMSTRLMAGGNLATRIAATALEPAAALRTLRHIADALDYAHTHNVVHRDIKPANILLDAAGEVYVADFGLAQLLEGGTRLTHAGALTGTPHYMSPEQALGKLADHRSDIYSLGIVAYEIFTGAVPFQAESPIGVLLKHVNERLPEPRNHRLPPGVLRSLQRAAAKHPEARWPSAGAFATNLERAVNVRRSFVAGGVPVIARGLERRSKWIAIGGTASAAAALIVWFAQATPPARNPETPGGDTSGQTAGPPPGGQVDDVDKSPPGGAGKNEADPPPPGKEKEAPPPRAKQPEVGREDAGQQPAVPTVPNNSSSSDSPRQLTDDDSPKPAPGRDDDGQAATPPPQALPLEKPEPRGATPSRDTFVAPVRRLEVRPQYPRLAITGQLEGVVIIEATVDASGSVVSARVKKPVHQLLDDAARKAVLQYRYAPARRNGIPVSATVDVPVSFSLR